MEIAKKLLGVGFIELFVLIGLLLGITFQISIAAPVIGGVSFANQTITILGAGFGTKSPAAPLVWENFEGGTAGTLLSTSNVWETQIECTRGSKETEIFSTDKAYSGTKSAKQLLLTGAPCWSRTRSGILGSQNQIFASYRFYALGGGAGDHVKMGRIGCNNDVHCWPSMGYTAFGPCYYYAFSDRYGEKVLWQEVPDVVDAWVRDDLWTMQGATGQANGAVGVWRDGAQKYFSTTINNNNLRQPYNQFFLPYYAEDGTRTIYVDDVYIDNTLARVELCPGSTWANRGKCDIQAPTEWANGRIVCKANTGNASSKPYIYVVDASGAANATGATYTTGITAPAYHAGSSSLLAISCKGVSEHGADFSLYLPEQGNFSVSIFNVTGEKIFQYVGRAAAAGYNTIRIAAVSTGIRLAVLEQNRHKIAKSFSVMR